MPLWWSKKAGSCHNSSTHFDVSHCLYSFCFFLTVERDYSPSQWSMCPTWTRIWCGKWIQPLIPCSLVRLRAPCFAELALLRIRLGKGPLFRAKCLESMMVARLLHYPWWDPEAFTALLLIDPMPQGLALAQADTCLASADFVGGMKQPWICPKGKALHTASLSFRLHTHYTHMPPRKQCLTQALAWAIHCGLFTSCRKL